MAPEARREGHGSVAMRLQFLDKLVEGKDLRRCHEGGVDPTRWQVRWSRLLLLSRGGAFLETLVCRLMAEWWPGLQHDGHVWQRWRLGQVVRWCNVWEMIGNVNLDKDTRAVGFDWGGFGDGSGESVLG